MITAQQWNFNIRVSVWFLMLAAGVWKMKMLRAIVTLWRLSTSSEFVQKNCIFHQLLFFSTCFWQINMRMAKNEFCNDKGIKTFSQDTSYGVQFVFRSLLFYQSISAILHRSGNRPFLSSPGPLFPYTRLSVQPLICKWFFILMQIKLIFTRKVVHFASFWKRGFSELGSGLLIWTQIVCT